jgi:23S rRNA (guanosine2251-2'-O)-methyltransferase
MGATGQPGQARAVAEPYDEPAEEVNDHPCDGLMPGGSPSPTVRPVSSPRDRFITVYGRQPVLEALADDRVRVDKVLLARTARGAAAEEILAAAAGRGVPVERPSPERVSRISGNARHDQGVAADVVAPGLGTLEAWLGSARAAAAPCALLLLDGVTNPANVGMVVRTATAAGLDGVVLPRVGAPDVGPLVIKASAGVAFRATILRTDTAVGAARTLGGAGFDLVGLRGTDPAGSPPATLDLFEAPLPERAAFVLGSETDGVSAAVAAEIASWRSIPLAGGVESLNVAVAAGVVAYEVVRRRHHG